MRSLAAPISVDDTTRHAFVVNSGKMHDLNDWLAADSTGWELQEARGINDSGWIVGIGTNPDGDVRAFLAKEVPEPGTAVLFLIGFCALVTLRCTRNSPWTSWSLRR